MIQTLNRTRAVDSRLRGNDDIQGAHPQHRHSREGGNPLPVSEPHLYSAQTRGHRQLGYNRILVYKDLTVLQYVRHQHWSVEGTVRFGEFLQRRPTPKLRKL